MKSFITSLILLLSINTFASKARVQALNSSFHLVDPQTIYRNPLDLTGMKNFIAIESGSTDALSTTDNAEGAISYGLNEHAQLAISLGHKDDAIMGVRSLINTTTGTTYLTPQNPIHLFYGYRGADMVYAFGISYSGKNDKVALLKESSALASFGVQWNTYQVYALYTLVNNVEAAGGKRFEGAGYLNLAGRMVLDTMTLGLDLFLAKAKSSTNNVEDKSFAYQSIVVGLVDLRSKDGSDYFYGAQIAVTALKDRRTDNDFKRTILPIWFGIESKGPDWLTIRGSIQQSIFIGQSKDDIGVAVGDGYNTGATGSVAEFSAIPNNTTAAFGLGFTFKQLTIDGTLKGLIGAAGVNQRVDSDNLLSQVGLTYNF